MTWPDLEAVDELIGMREFAAQIKLLHRVETAVEKAGTVEEALGLIRRIEREVYAAPRVKIFEIHAGAEDAESEKYE